MTGQKKNDANHVAPNSGDASPMPLREWPEQHRHGKNYVSAEPSIFRSARI